MVSQLDWYIVKIISGQEKKIKEHVSKEIELLNLSKDLDEIITPTQKVYQVRKLKDGKSKKITIDKNLYPGYMFIHANLHNGEILHLIKNTPSIIGFLDVSKRSTKLPKPMREKEAQKVLNKVNQTVEIEEDIRFSIGDKVKINEGVFHDLIGTVNQVSEDKKKLKIMVKIFNRSTPIELNFFQVEKQ